MLALTWDDGTETSAMILEEGEDSIVPLLVNGNKASFFEKSGCTELFTDSLENVSVGVVIECKSLSGNWSRGCIISVDDKSHTCNVVLLAGYGTVRSCCDFSLLVIALDTFLICICWFATLVSTRLESSAIVIFMPLLQKCFLRW